jgi:hypothetical protein
VATLDAAAIRAIALQSAPPAGATRDERAALMRVSERLRHKDRQAAETEWAFLVERAARRDDKHKDWIHIESWSHYVLGQAYLEPNEDLKHRAEKVRFYHAQNLAALERRAELDDAKRQLDRSAPSTQTVTVRRLTMSDSFQPGRSAVTFGETEPVTVESVADELQSAVVLCKLTEEQEQMANIDLQNALQKQQQTMQTMSNVSKMLHDTAMAVIRKIGG